MNRLLTASSPILIFFTLLAGCASWSPDRDVLYQHGNLKTPRPAQADGIIPLNKVRRRGDFGFGRLADTPGLIILEGKRALQASEGGRIKQPRYDERLTAFMVTSFDTDSQYETLRPRNLNQLVTYIESVIGQRDASYAIHVAGRFHFVEVSSPPEESGPNRMHRNVSGTLIGFRLAETIDGQSRVRYPFVFVNRTRRFGGLVQNVTVSEASITLDRLSHRDPLKLKPQPGDSSNASRSE